MDNVITQKHWELLPRLALAVGVAALVDAAASFANSQVLGVAGQRAITEMRKDVEAHVMEPFQDLGRHPVQAVDDRGGARVGGPGLAPLLVGEHHEQRQVVYD